MREKRGLCAGSRTDLFGIQISLVIPRHVLGQANRLVAN